MKINNHHLARGLSSKDRFSIVALLLVYAIIFLPAMLSDWSHRDFMDIDPQSIMYSIEGLTAAPYYNMNAQYHSQFYGWTYFSLHFVFVMLLKALGLASEITINFTARTLLFLIGGFTVFHAYRLCRNFIPAGWSTFGVLAFVTNPVSAHFFITIHPESLGMLLQIIAARLFLAVYRSPDFSHLHYLFAIAFLSLAALCKQPFVVTGGLLFLCFLLLQMRRAHSTGLTAHQVGQLALQTVGVAIAVLFIIHPYAILEPARFLQAQLTLMSEHSPKSFAEVAPQWGGVMLSNFVVLLNFILFPICLLLPRSHFPYKISVIFTIIATSIFIFQARLFITSTYLYPAYGFLFFNATYFLARVLWPQLKTHLGQLRASMAVAALIPPAVLVLGSNFANSSYQAHAKYFLDGLSTSHVAWSYLSKLPVGTRIAYSPNVAVLDPLKKTGCHAWQGCADATKLEAFNPDFVVFSPRYSHFQSSAYLDFVEDHGFQRVAKIERDVATDLTCGKDPGLSLSTGWVAQLKKITEFFPANIASCLLSYRAALSAMRAGAIVMGLPIEIYARPK